MICAAASSLNPFNLENMGDAVVAAVPLRSGLCGIVVVYKKDQGPGENLEETSTLSGVLK